MADFLDRLGDELGRAVRTPIDATPETGVARRRSRLRRILAWRGAGHAGASPGAPPSARRPFLRFRPSAGVLAALAMIAIAAVAVIAGKPFASAPRGASSSASEASAGPARSSGESAARGSKGAHRPKLSGGHGSRSPSTNGPSLGESAAAEESSAQGSSAQPAGRPTFGRQAANRRAARSTARSLLGKLSLPADARRLPTDPASANALASAPRPGSPQLVDLHRYWLLPQRPQAVIEWVEGHRPVGSHLQGHGHGSPVLASWTFAYPAKPGQLTTAWLVVQVAAAKQGGTAIRADGEAVWVKPRPASERIPAGVKAVTITARDRARHISLQRTLTNHGPVNRIIALVESLPLAQGDSYHCPADTSRRPIIQMLLRRTATSPPLARLRINDNGCGSVTLRIRGHAQPPLGGAEEATEALRALLHTKL